MTMSDDELPADRLAEMERVAVDLARLAGREIEASLGRTLSIRYKTGDDERALFRDPVSEVDGRCEALIRERLDTLFPSHGVLGEEMDAKPGHPDAPVWAVDPVDGTTNFINGFPLFAASVGVLHRGRPIVGAVWCASTHALRPGVYHATRGGPLRFEGEVLAPRLHPGVRRRLAGEPSWSDDVHGPWDVRKTGSAAIECAFVAAGLLHVARFATPNIWDVAGGIVLVEAAGLTVHEQAPDGWRAFERFEGREGEPDDRLWRRPLVIGEAKPAEQMIARLEAVAETVV